jgi:aspartyl-tRNA(Asn)/glutamyl-tRNA(Gln) amidotransferase subunit B
LLEIVTEPVMRSAAEAVAYAKALHALVRWIGICDGNLQEGSFRVDANVSVRRQGQTEFGTRCEIKNLNSFRFLERAIQVEAQRQVELLEEGGVVIQQTRLFDPDRDETRAMRSKEDAHDYRYFPDPDLPPLVVSEEWMAQVQSQMPTLPAVRRAELEQRFGLSAGDAALVTATREASDFFDLGVAALEAAGGADSTRVKLLANWVMGEMASALNRENLDIQDSPLSAQRLTDLVVRVADGTLSNKIAREVFAKLWATPGLTADQVIESEGLRQVQDSGQLQGWVQEVIAANPKMVEEFQSGKDKALNALMGQVMKRSGGKANPQAVTELLRSAMQAGRPDGS